MNLVFNLFFNKNPVFLFIDRLNKMYYICNIMVKRVWQPKKLKRVKKHGFFKRMLTKGGRNVLKRRLAKGRKVLARALFKK